MNSAERQKKLQQLRYAKHLVEHGSDGIRVGTIRKNTMGNIDRLIEVLEATVMEGATLLVPSELHPCEQVKDAFSAAVCCVLIQDGRVLGISRRDDPSVFCLPGGKVELGESLIQAAHRELFEETSIFGTTFTPLYAKVVPPGKDGRSFVTTAFLVDYERGQDVTTEQGFSARWLSMPELVRMPSPFGPFNKRVYNKLMSMGRL